MTKANEELTTQVPRSYYESEGGGGGGVTSDSKWGGGGGLKTILLSNFYNFHKSGGPPLPFPLRGPCESRAKVL